MGYFSQQEIETQYDVDRMVAFYRSHKEELPEWLLDWIVRDSDRFFSAIEAWEQQPYPPKPASSHVALQPRAAIREERKMVRKVNRQSFWGISGLITFTVAVGVALVWAAEVFA